MIYFLMMMNEETEKQDALYTVIPTTIFKKEIKKYKKQPKKFEKIEEIVQILINKGTSGIPKDKNPHLLIGNYKGCVECHIEPDLLLIWKQYEEEKLITLNRIGTHSELFS